MLGCDNTLSPTGRNYMTCLNPKIAKPYWHKIINQKTGEIYETKGLKFIKQNQILLNDPDMLSGKYMLIPCQKCQGCRVDYASEFSTRAYLESLQHKESCFITLTYNNENIPKNRSLNKKDFQDFFKRLRKNTGKKIRYMLCGEYGPKTLRCHGHMLCWGYRPKDLKFYKKNHVGDFLFTSEELNKIWGKGYTIIGNITYESAAYVARYVYKKSYGIDKDFYKKHGREPEFILTSRRPGLATNAFTNKKIWEKIKRNMGVLIPTKDGVKLKKIPTFLREKWKNFEDRKEYFKLFDKRARELLNDTRARMEKTDLNYFKYLKMTYNLARERFKRLDKRSNIMNNE